MVSVMARTSGLLNHGLWIEQKKTSVPYTTAQVFAWLRRIGYLDLFPNCDSIEAVTINLKTLRLLNRLFLTSVPFDNTEMH